MYKDQIRTLELRALSILVLSGCITPMILGKMPPFLVVICFGTLFPIWMNLPFIRIRQHALWKGFTFVSFGMFLLSRVLQTNWFHSIIILVLFSVIFELYGETRKHAHIRILSLLSFFIVIAQFRFDQGVHLFAGILVFFFGVGICLMRFRQIRLAEQMQEQVPGWKHVYLPMVILFLLLVPVSLGFFWTIPRAKFNSMKPFSLSEGNFISAFADRVSLNDIGTISQSNRHVLDLIPLDGEKVPTPYLVGRVLDRFEAGLWVSTTERDRRLRSPDPDGIVQVNQKPVGTASSRFEVSMRPLQGNTIFFFPSVVGIQIRDPIYCENGKTHFFHGSRYPLILQYTLHCASSRWDPFPREKDLVRYLDIRENQEYFLRKAEEIFTTEPRFSTTEARLNALYSFFQKNFLYTLKINNFGQSDPLRYFLETTREGHCELFASSAIMILRAAGIPSRLVTGFYLPQIINNSFYHVTEASAHAWVEVWDGEGWLTFDPTGVVGLAPVSWVGQRLAIFNRVWEDLIVKWDFFSQRDLYTAIKSFLNQTRLLVFLVGITLVLAVLMGFRYTGIFWKRALGHKSAIEEFEDLLTEWFPAKPACLPWGSHIGGLRINPGLRSAMKRWVEQYFHCFFRGLPPKEVGLLEKELRRDLLTLRKMIRNSNKG